MSEARRQQTRRPEQIIWLPGVSDEEGSDICDPLSTFYVGAHIEERIRPLRQFRMVHFLFEIGLHCRPTRGAKRPKRPIPIGQHPLHAQSVNLL